MQVTCFKQLHAIFINIIYFVLLVPRFVSLHTHSLWETICDADIKLLGSEHFVFKIPWEPLSRTWKMWCPECPPPPLPQWNMVRFRDFGFKLVQNTSRPHETWSHWGTLDLSWSRIHPQNETWSDWGTLDLSWSGIMHLPGFQNQGHLLA